MDIGIALPHVGSHASPQAIVNVAQEAERLGFGAVWVLERLLRPTFPFPQFGGRLALMPETYATTYRRFCAIRRQIVHPDAILYG